MCEEKQLTKLTLQVGDTVASWEVPTTDTDMDDLLNAFMGLLISHTWLPVTVLTSMRDFAEDNIDVLTPNELS